MLCDCGHEFKPKINYRHRLMCGDSTNVDDAGRLIEYKKAGAIIADPPYNLGFKYGDNVDDKKSEAEYVRFIADFVDIWFPFVERQLITPGKQNLKLWAKYNWSDIGCWYKRNAMSSSKISHLSLWEPILFFGEFGPRARANDIFEHNLSLQEVGKIGNETMHPCPKILSLWLDLIEWYSKIGEIVIDPFIGAGTTMVAAEQTNRICHGMEIEPKYCAVVLERMAGMGLNVEVIDQE